MVINNWFKKQNKTKKTKKEKKTKTKVVEETL